MGADDASSAEMGRPSADPLALDEETVERLLAGDLSPAQTPPEYAEVAVLLAATVAAPSPDELAGQAVALAELRAVTQPRPAAPITRRVARLRRRRRVGLAVVVVVGALVTGGAAAAATGQLPGPVRDAARSILTTLGGAEPTTPTSPGRQPAPGTGSPDGGDAATGPQGPRLTGPTHPGSGAAGAGSAADPEVDRLCRAFLAGERGKQGKKLEAAAFERLADAAGGDDKVAAFCQGSEPGTAKPREHKQQAPPDDQDLGQGGSPLSTGGGNQGQTEPPGG
jgi:hypothetical protein